MNTSRFISVVLAIVFCFSAIAFGQGTTGKIAGTVADSTGAIIPGATVAIESKGLTTGYKRTITTDKNGYYIFSNVPVGNYKVTITANNFKTEVKNAEVVVDKTKTVDANLLVASSLDSHIDVEVDKIDETGTNVDTNVTKEIIDALPKGTNYTSLLKISPSVRPEVLGGGFQVDGSSGAENRFIIDGQEVTNFQLGTLNLNNNLPFEFLQQVQVKSTGTEAEYSGSTGGVINAVTLGGNNEWHGNFGISIRPSQLQGDASPILNQYGSDANEFEFFTPNKDGGTDYFPVALISGPILKDRVWGLLSYAPQIYRAKRTKDYFDTSNPNRNIIETETYESTTTVQQLFGRIDAQPVSSLRLFGTYLWNPITVDGELPTSNLSVGSPFITVNEFADRGGRVNSNSVNGQATWTPFNWMFANFRAGRSFLNEKLGSYGRDTGTRFAVSAGSPLDPCNQNDINLPPSSVFCRGFNTGANGSIKYDVSTRTTFDADAGLVGINFGGRHNIKGGFQFSQLKNDVDSGYVSTGYVLLYYGLPITNFTGFSVTPLPFCDFSDIPANADNCTLGTARLVRIGTFGEAKSDNYSLYGQDSWTIKNRLTINFGLRFEKEIVPTYNETLNENTAITFGWGDKIAPRFGAAFDLFGNGKTKIYGSYGWFYDRFKYELPRQLFGSVQFNDSFAQITPARGFSPFDYTFERMLGDRQDIIPGGQCPIVNQTGYVECTIDRQVTGNGIPEPLPVPLVDPDLKPMRQSEFALGVEHELGNNFIIGGRYIHKELDSAVEDVGIFTSFGTERFMVGNPGRGIPCEFSQGINLPCTEAERKYDAVEISIDKRAATYFFNANYTWSRLFGNYSGLASSDETGRVSPNTNRFFDQPNLGFDANGAFDNGKLATDRPHAFKAYGGYSLDWFSNGTNVTNLSAFTTIQSGTPLTTQYNLFNVDSSILFGRGDLGRTEVFTETDFAVSHISRFGRDNRFSIEPFIEIRNVFDERNEISRNTLISNVNFTNFQLNAGGCMTCSDQFAVIDTIFNNGGIEQFVLNYLNANPNQINNAYNQTNLFQFGRDVRFGLNFRF